MVRRRRLLALTIAVAVLVAACSSGGTSGSKDGASSVRGDLVVLAAASLTGAVTKIAHDFEVAHPGVHVRVTFNGSARLAAGILQGVPADVFVAADEPTMERIREAKRIEGQAETVATNELQIVVSQRNPRDINSIEDLTRGAVVALCRVEVPCGVYAERAFRLAGLVVPSAGREESVKAVLSKVQLGEADAGIVYRTDVLGAKGVRGIELSRSDQVTAAYPAAVLRDAPNPVTAAAFYRYLLSAQSQEVFAKAGFGAP